MRFRDGSAIVPLPITQPLSTETDRWFAAAPALAVWTCTTVEVVSALGRLVRAAAVAEAARPEDRDLGAARRPARGRPRRHEAPGDAQRVHHRRAPSRARRRPAVVLQHDRFNRSALNTVVVVAITSNLEYAALPGNVRLAKGEAGLPRPSVANVTQVATVDRDDVRGRPGRLTPRRLLELWRGVELVLRVEDRGG